MSAQSILAAIALGGLIALSILFGIHEVPKDNHDFMIYALGALSGALTVGGGSKVADKITTARTTVQGDQTVEPGQ